MQRYVMEDSRLELLERGTIEMSAAMDDQPERMRLPLKPHQRAVLRHMRQLEEGEVQHTHETAVTSTLGLLCDKVGSGKSMEVLARLCQRPLLSPRPQINNGICLEAVHVSVSSTPKYRTIPTNLLVVPHGIVSQWRQYVEQHTDLRMCVLQRRCQIEQVDQWSEPSDFPELLLCSSTMCKPLAFCLGSRCPLY